MISFFEDFSCVYVCKAKHDNTNDTYDINDFEIVLKTDTSTGQSNFVYQTFVTDIFYQSYQYLQSQVSGFENDMGAKPKPTVSLHFLNW